MNRNHLHLHAQSTKAMSSLINHVHLIGRLGKDPEVKTFESGKKSARFSVVTREVHINESGRRVESTEWISVTAWEQLANVAEKYLHKGSEVAICGRIQTRDYIDAKGERKWITEILATDILLLGAKLD